MIFKNTVLTFSCEEFKCCIKKGAARGRGRIAVTAVEQGGEFGRNRRENLRNYGDPGIFFIQRNRADVFGEISAGHAVDGVDVGAVWSLKGVDAEWGVFEVVQEAAEELFRFIVPRTPEVLQDVVKVEFESGFTETPVAVGGGGDHECSPLRGVVPVAVEFIDRGVGRIMEFDAVGDEDVGGNFLVAGVEKIGVTAVVINEFF